MIKIGIESDVTELYNQLLMYPERYFFILVIEGRTALCVQTCDSRGENMKVHEVDGLIPDDDGNLVSAFQDYLLEAVMRREIGIEYLEGERFAISQAIRMRIMELPGFIEWILSSEPVKKRCLMLCPSWNL